MTELEKMIAIREELDKAITRLAEASSECCCTMESQSSGSINIEYTIINNYYGTEDDEDEYDEDEYDEDEYDEDEYDEDEYESFEFPNFSNFPINKFNSSAPTKVFIGGDNIVVHGNYVNKTTVNNTHRETNTSVKMGDSALKMIGGLLEGLFE